MTTDYTILYVEDDTDFAALNIQWFTERGYDIVYARDGSEALKALEDTTTDIALLDVMLPDMTGFNIMEHIRDKAANIPVIFLTSLSDSEHAIAGLALGAYDYIRKDADLTEVEARIASVLSRTGSHDNIGRITENSYMDNYRMTVVVHGEEHKVGYRVIKSLQLLLQQKNRLCTRDYLTANVWGDDFINRDIYLNQTVATLRRILSADEQVKLISHRNVGLILQVEE